MELSSTQNTNFPLETETAIHEFAQKYPLIPFVLATGKGPSGAANILHKFKFMRNNYGVFLNKAVVLKQDNTKISPIPGFKVCYERKMRPESVVWFIDMSPVLGYTLVLYNYDTIYAPHSDSEGNHKFFLDGLTRFHEPSPVRLDLPQRTRFRDDILADRLSIHKMILMKDPSLIKQLKDDLTSHPEFPNDIPIIHTMPEMLEGMPKDSSKSHAIREICNLEGIKMEQVLAFGDGSNDFEMIRDVGVGVSMSNAKEILKSVSQYQTLSNDEAGVGVFLRKVFLE